MYLHLHYISILLLPSCYIYCISIFGMLSRDDSKEWFQNMTRKLDSKNPYCHLCCLDMSSEPITKNCGFHTMCVYETNKTGPSCKGYIRMEFSAAERNTIVDAHNTLRNRVASGKEKLGDPGPQPQAANMRFVEWDEELAEIAERWVMQCIYSHDYCRDSAKYPVGQNIAQGNLSEVSEIIFIREWYNVVTNFPHSKVENYDSVRMAVLGLRTYTQLVWADTYQIGCARAVFQKLDQDRTVYTEQFFCNYGPTGNIPGQAVYEIGPPCTKCPEGTHPVIEYPSLCGRNSLSEEVLIANRTYEITDGTSRDIHSIYFIFMTIVILVKNVNL